MDVSRFHKKLNFDEEKMDIELTKNSIVVCIVDVSFWASQQTKLVVCLILYHVCIAGIMQ